MVDTTIKLPATPPKCRPSVLRLMLVGSVLYTLVMLLWVVSSVHDIASTSESLPLSIVHLFTNGQHTPTPEELEAEAHALTVKSLPGGATVERQFKCIGWRATTDCSANGARDVANDKPCNRHVEDGASGYCEIEDVESVEARRQARLKLLDQGLPATINDEQVQAELEELMRTPPPTLEPPEPDNLPDPAMWTHLWTFRNTSRRVDYRIRSYSAEPDFPEWQRCYGQRNISDNEHYYSQRIADLGFAGLETHLRRFAMEGAQLLEKHQPSRKLR
ncbi:hypothetical protein PC113_g10709 [Phytophthora cactorum]|uniref:Uncharacterized protein n=1 Tax=Phytophthora cactorum TaxID=29920 RepID=A0A8T0Z5K2_9STRA|nr:hypothetical protein PC113_g10709 [Phytophthora cactorum]